MATAASTLTEQLDALIAEHGLASISIGRLTRRDGSPFWAVYAQGVMPNGEREIGTNDDFDAGPSEALASAIGNLNAKRIRTVVVPELAEAA